VKVFVTGASSTPGFKIVVELAKSGYRIYAQYNSHEIPSMDYVTKVKIDFINEMDKLVNMLNEVKPDAIIHTAALGDVDKCEIDKALAWKINVEATHAIAKMGGKLGSYIVYLSTDYVFDGEKGLYKEEDTPNPVNYYGLTKLVAENIVRSSTNNFSVVRTSHIYGFGMGRENFARYVIKALSQKQKVRALTDQWLSPTLNTLLAKAIVEIIERRYVGIIHVAGERTSRYEFAKAIAKKFGFDENLIEPISISEIRFVAKRPRDSSLDISKAKSIIKTDFYSLKNALNILYNEWLELRRGGIQNAI